jgi:hypothetical protein
MTEVPRKRQARTINTVPLKRSHLVQPELFHQTQIHYLPLIVPGEEAYIYDADEWQKYNGRRGIVTGYSYFTGLHNILVSGIGERQFLGREIMKSRR